ncbi:hypothetical protein R1flu_025630 [Riccia fluitans]|uniref:Uncharacterized protein n=1 Tax=Riccia fluitans TaxID=41844 RepID=A0ABD1XZ72_9MARC
MREPSGAIVPLESLYVNCVVDRAWGWPAEHQCASNRERKLDGSTRASRALGDWRSCQHRAAMGTAGRLLTRTDLSEITTYKSDIHD